MRVAPLAILLGLSCAPSYGTTLYIVGNCTSCSITAPSTATWTVQAWGAGAGANFDGNSQAGRAGDWAQNTGFSATGSTSYSIQLGAPGVSTPLSTQNPTMNNGGDTWFSSNTYLLANGGNSPNSDIGSSFNAGGFGAYYTSPYGYPGGGGAGGPQGTGGYGGAPTSAYSGAGGGGNGGSEQNGSGQTGNVSNTTTGGAGATSYELGLGGVGGAGGFSVGASNGSNGPPGAGGGGGFGNNSTGGSGGNGGDDYDNGGGGAGGPGVGGGVYNGGNGGTPGGGATYGTDSGTQGVGGYGEIKITYTGTTDPDQIYVWGNLSVIQIPATWTSSATVSNYGSGCSTTTIPITPGASLAVAVNPSCQPLTLTKLTSTSVTPAIFLLMGIGR